MSLMILNGKKVTELSRIFLRGITKKGKLLKWKLKKQSHDFTSKQWKHIENKKLFLICNYQLFVKRNEKSFR